MVRDAGALAVVRRGGPGTDPVHDELSGDEPAAAVEPDRRVVLGHDRDGEVRDC